MTQLSPEEYRKIMRRDLIAKWMTPIAILLLAVVIIWLCVIRTWLGVPECCCCGHVAASSWPSVSASTVPASGVAIVSRGGAPTGEIPFAPYRHGNAPVTSGSATAVAASPSLTFVSSGSALDMDAAPSTPVDITGELGDGGDEYLNIGPPITGIEPPDDCEGICWVVGKHHHREPPPCVTQCTTPPPVVGAAPDAETWILMLVGFGLVGLVIRRSLPAVPLGRPPVS